MLHHAIKHLLEIFINYFSHLLEVMSHIMDGKDRNRNLSQITQISQTL